MNPAQPEHLVLPRAAAEFLPHRPPMQLVEELRTANEGNGTVSVRLAQGCPLLGPTGGLEGVAMVELLAQGYAAVQGYADLSAGKAPGRGFLVGIRRARVCGSARVGDELTITVRTVARIDTFAMVEGEVYRGEEELARATLKLWLPETDA